MARMTLDQALEIVEGAVAYEIDGYMQNFETDQSFVVPLIKELETAIKLVKTKLLKGAR